MVKTVNVASGIMNHNLVIKLWKGVNGKKDWSPVNFHGYLSCLNIDFYVGDGKECWYVTVDGFVWENQEKIGIVRNWCDIYPAMVKKEREKRKAFKTEKCPNFKPKEEKKSVNNMVFNFTKLNNGRILFASYENVLTREEIATKYNKNVADAYALINMIAYAIEGGGIKLIAKDYSEDVDKLTNSEHYLRLKEELETDKYNTLIPCLRMAGENLATAIREDKATNHIKVVI